MRPVDGMRIGENSQDSHAMWLMLVVFFHHHLLVYILTNVLWCNCLLVSLSHAPCRGVLRPGRADRARGLQADTHI
jgi:hypothetical protein